MPPIEAVLGKTTANIGISDISEIPPFGTPCTSTDPEVWFFTHPSGGPSGSFSTWMQIQIDEGVIGGTPGVMVRSGPLSIAPAPHKVPNRPPHPLSVGFESVYVGDGHLWFADVDNGVWRQSDNPTITAP